MYLRGKTVGILTSPYGVEHVELVEPWESLAADGADVRLIGTEPGIVRAYTDDEPSASFDVDHDVHGLDPTRFDALIIPGGADNCARLAADRGAVEFVSKYLTIGRPIGAICHAVWLLIAADGVAGRQLTSWPGTSGQVLEAGGTWVDRRVVVDGNLVTSRMPDDIPAFLTQLTSLLDR